MLWNSQPVSVILAILSGFFTAFSDVLSKDYMRKTSADGFFTLYIRWLLCSIFLLPLLVIGRSPALDLTTLLLCLMLLPLEILAGYLYMRSLEISESTLVLPFQSFTPVFIPPIAVLIIGESYSSKGIIGIALVFLGTFMFLRENKNEKVNKKGILYMIASALIYAFTSVVGRYITLKMSPLFFSVLYMTTLSLTLTPYFVKRYGREVRERLGKSIVSPLMVGATTALAVITHFVSVAGIETGYMISLKRTSVVFSVILGYVLLKEKTDIKERIVGAFLMMGGAIVISSTVVKR